MAMLQQAKQNTSAPPTDMGAEGTGEEQVPVSAAPPEGNSAEAAPMQGDAGESELAEGEEPASPEEQKEYERAIGALYQLLYVDDKTSKTALDMLQPEAKVDSIAKASVLIIQQLDDKLDLDDAVIPQLIMDVPDQLVEIAEKAKGMTFNDGELQAILGATQEMAMRVFDIDADQAQQTVGSMSPSKKAAAEQTYKKYLGNASKAVPAQGGA